MLLATRPSCNVEEKGAVVATGCHRVQEQRYEATVEGEDECLRPGPG